MSEEVIKNPLEVEEEKGSFFDLRAILDVLILNWQWFLLSLIICLGIAWLHLRYTTPYYSAYAKMFVKTNSTTNLRSINALGEVVQSYGMENEKLIVNTRDTFGIAMKSCAGVVNGKFHFIYKDPKTDTGKLKKSHKGIVWVQRDSDGNLFETDEHDTMLNENASELKTVFKDGVMLNKTTFAEIRARIDKEA